MTNPHILALLGGVLIGGASALLLAANGRIAGISGIVGEPLDFWSDEAMDWRLAFLLGLATGALALVVWYPVAFAGPAPHGPAVLLGAGMLVGVGTRMGNGCTSGHGVCGVARGQTRSIVATAVFIGVGMLTVAAFRAMGGMA